MTNFAESPYYEKYEDWRLNNLDRFGEEWFREAYGRSGEHMVEQEIKRREAIVEFDIKTLERISKSIKEDKDIIENLTQILSRLRLK